MARDSSLEKGVIKRSLGQMEDVGNTGDQCSSLDLRTRQNLVISPLEAESRRGRPGLLHVQLSEGRTGANRATVCSLGLFLGAREKTAPAC